MTKLSTSINFFAVFHNITPNGSLLRYPLSEYRFDSRGLFSISKSEGGHIGYQTATYHASSTAGR